MQDSAGLGTSGAEGVRTLYPLVANQVLSQLSYGPKYRWKPPSSRGLHDEHDYFTPHGGHYKGTHAVGLDHSCLAEVGWTCPVEASGSGLVAKAHAASF